MAFIILILCTIFCKTFGDLVNDNTPAYDEDEVKMNVTDIVLKYGYPCEEHTVETEDGYILNLHRIPHGKQMEDAVHKIPVFLVHGLCFSSADFIITGPEKALAYVLADEGYDVWLANARGNFYSRRHRIWDPDTDLQFWKFTWDEIGYYDHPASIDYILNTTKTHQLHYIGHSQGSITFFVMTSLRPEYNNKIRTAHSLTGNVFFNNVGGSWWLGSFLLKTFKELFMMYEMGEVFPRANTDAHRLWLERAKFPSINFIWRNFIGYRGASNIAASVGEDRFPLVRGHTPAGCSAFQFLHFAQIFENEFQRFNHGTEQNDIVYGSKNPPKYNLSDVNAPVYVYYSATDDTSSVQDIDKLVASLPNCKLKFEVNRSNFNHFDFLYSNQAKLLIYDNIVKYMNDTDILMFK